MIWENVGLKGKKVKEGKNIEDKYAVGQLMVLTFFVYLKEDHV